MDTHPIDMDVVVRPPTLEDAEGVAALFNASAMEFYGKQTYSVEEIRSDWQLPDFDLATGAIVVLTPGGRLVGYGDLWGSSATGVQYRSWVRVHPEFRGRGIGTWINRWVAARARERLDLAPEGARVVLLTATFANHPPARELLEALGMEVSHTTSEMEIELDSEPPAPRWPDGIVVRPRRPDEARTIYQAYRDSFRDHRGYVEEPFESGFERWRHINEEDPDFDPSLWFVALDGDAVAGFTVCKPTTTDDPDAGWIHQLGVPRAWRRRGLGLALLLHCFGALYRLGKARAALMVDATSLTGATRLYEKAGMHVVRQHLTYQKELRPGRELTTQALED